MAEKNIINDNINKRDLDLILEVNRKAIEIETEVAEQNEEVIAILNKNKETASRAEEKLDKLISQVDELNRDIFKMQVLFVTGLLSLVIQIIQMFIKK